MAAQELEVDISHGRCLSLRCTLDTRNLPEFQHINISEFRFGGGGWILTFFKGTYYGLVLRRCSGVAPNPLYVSVHLERSEDGRILCILPEERRFTDELREEDEWFSIWYQTKRRLLRSVPEFRLHRVLELIVVLKAEDSTGTLFSLAPSVQATSNDPCLESLLEDFSKLLDEGPNSDFEFQCGGQSTKAHRAVVSARSQVIATMLATDMVEGRTKVVKIPDMGTDVFEKFLRYLYTGKLDGLTFGVALNLFEAGDQYAVTGLAKRCSEYLSEHLSVENACEVLVIADAHSDAGLVEKVVGYMVDERVPVAFEAWPAFCDEHPRLANKVLNRGWKALTMSKCLKTTKQRSSKTSKFLGTISHLVLSNWKIYCAICIIVYMVFV